MWMAGCTCIRPRKGTDHMKTWTRERKIYLAVGILACAVGMVLIFFPR